MRHGAIMDNVVAYCMRSLGTIGDEMKKSLSRSHIILITQHQREQEQHSWPLRTRLWSKNA